MNTIKRRGRFLTAGVAAVAAGGVLVGAAPGDAATAQPTSAAGRQPSSRHSTGCTTVNLVEPTSSFYSNIPYGPGVEEEIGFQGAAFDTLYDAAGTKIGTSVVSTDNVYAQTSNGHVFEHIAETMQLSDGTFAGSGTFDRTTVAAQDWQHGWVVGISGRYAGLAGPWTWRLASIQAPYPTQETAVLCPADVRVP